MAIRKPKDLFMTFVSFAFFHWNYMIINLFFSAHRRYGTKCSGCGQGIAPSDLVRKPRDKVFHLNCFTCCICRKQLSTGEQLYVLDDNKFICKDDYLLGKAPSCGHNSLSGKFWPVCLCVNLVNFFFLGHYLAAMFGDCRGVRPNQATINFPDIPIGAHLC